MELLKLGYDNKILLDSNFIDKNSYWLSSFPQGGDDWKNLRGHFFSASNFGYGVGHGLQFKTPEDLALVMKGLKTEEYNFAMQMGNRYEAKARDLYMEFNKVYVAEVGLA